MKIKDLIKQLNDIEKEHGNLDVMIEIMLESPFDEYQGKISSGPLNLCTCRLQTVLDSLDYDKKKGIVYGGKKTVLLKDF